MSGLHGVETIELTSGTVAVETISTAVIGLVGTAPAAATATSSGGVVGSALLDNVLTFRAKTPGRTENQLKVEAVPAVPDAQNPVAVPTSASYSGTTLSVVLGCDDKGVVTATAAGVADAVNAVTKSQIEAEATTSTGLVAAFSLVLSGGEDEPFPLNTPVSVTGAAMTARLGTAGTLPQAMADISNQTSGLVVVVRVEESTKPDQMRAALLAGMNAWSAAEYHPRILIATGFSEDDAIGKGLETMANKLRAVAYVDCASMATPKEVLLRQQNYGARVELLRPRVLITTLSGENICRPYSACAAGLRARIDADKGWWWSKSNQEVYGILGLEQVDEFVASDANCQANLLNMANVSTIVRRDGFRHWGNRLCSPDPQWRFESVRRSADVIEDSIQNTVIQYVDRPLDKQNTDDIIGTINAYMRQLVSLGAIFGGCAWLDEALNTAETLAAGWVFIDYDFGPKSPTERITMRTKINKDYAVGALAEV